jgi:hypothetical protein
VPHRRTDSVSRSTACASLRERRPMSCILFIACTYTEYAGEIVVGAGAMSATTSFSTVRGAASTAAIATLPPIECPMSWTRDRL